MNKILWLIGGTTLAIAVFAILNSEELAPADGVDRTAGKVAGWGVKQRATGTGGQLLGKVKEFAGNVTGDQQTADEGVLDQAAGAVKNAAGQTAQALGQTIHDLNR